MILMENGRMDSKTELSSDSNRFIMEIGSKGIKSCFNVDSTIMFQNNDGSKSISTANETSNSESNFTHCNENSIEDRDDSICIVNGDDVSHKSENRPCNISKKTNSSQCNINSQNSCCKSLENELSSLNLSKCEFVKTSETDEVQCLEFDSVKSPEITIKQEANEDAFVNKNNAERKKSSPDVTTLRDTVSFANNFNLEKLDNETSEITYISYESENQMPDIMKLIQKDLSEPYSIYTYRYFIHNWPHLCFLAVSKGKSVGAIVCKLDVHRKIIKRGYIAMLAVDECYRKKGIGSNLVLKAIRVMATEGADEVVLETEITNQPALRLYENLGFVRDKRLFRYYLNGVDALRLKLWLR